MEPINKKLFPRNESWATGDEAVDLKLTQALSKVFDNLCFENISEFYFMASEIKPRAFNPDFKLNIILVTKALLAYLEPLEFNDIQFKKLEGKYFSKIKIDHHLEKQDIVIDGIRMLKKFRYEEQLDFFIDLQPAIDHNPFVSFEIKKSPFNLQTKIIFKDLKRYLKNEIENGPNLPFIELLRGGKNIVIVHGLGEFWFENDQIYSFSLI